MFRARSRGAPLRRSVRRFADDVSSVRLASPKGHSPSSHKHREKRGHSAAPRLRRRPSREEEYRRMSREELRARERARSRSRSKLREQRALAALRRARSRERRKSRLRAEVSSSSEEDSSDESESSSEEEKPGLMSSMVSAVQSFLSKGDEESDSDDDSDDSGSDSDSESSLSETGKMELRQRALEAKRREQQMRAHARSAHAAKRMNKLYGESRREREMRLRALARARAAREDKARQYQILDRVAHEKEELARSRAHLKEKLEKERMKALKNQMR